LVLLLIFPIAVFAGKNTFTVKGAIGKLDSPAKVYLSYRAGNKMVTDSASLKKGAFTLNGEINNPAQATFLLNTEGTGMRSRTVKTLSFYVEKGKIRIQTDEIAMRKTFTPAGNELTKGKSAERINGYSITVQVSNGNQALIRKLRKTILKIYTNENFENQSISGPRVNTDNEKLKLAQKSVNNKMNELRTEALAWTQEQRADKAVRESYDKK
jgi:hypothetical protein